MPKTTEAATKAAQRKTDLRAIDDPAVLARAARIVRLALERGKLRPEDIAPADGPVGGTGGN